MKMTPLLQFFIFRLLFLIPGQGSAQTPNPNNGHPSQNLIRLPVVADKDQSTSPPLLSIYTTPSPSRRVVGPQVILAIWEDGAVIRSQNKIQGGSPYLSSKLESDQVTELLADVCQVASHVPPSDRIDYRGPDSSWATIAVWSKKCPVYWQSWHELMESSGKLVTIDGSVHSLQSGKTVEQVRKKKCSKEYQNFVRRWEEMKKMMLEIAPFDTLEPANPNLNFKMQRFPQNTKTINSAR